MAQRSRLQRGPVYSRRRKLTPISTTGLAPGQPFTVSDPSRGVIANDVNVYGVTLLTAPGAGTLTCGAMSSVLSETVSGICANGTFTYTPSGTATSDSFTYCANGTVTGTVCSSGLTAMVTLGPSNAYWRPDRDRPKLHVDDGKLYQDSLARPATGQHGQEQPKS